jgi:2-phospho-L-lactate guanylyltransferase (CobY/MobA/RfbA family)
MATIVVPFRPSGKTRLGQDGSALARAMLDDVLAACRPVAPTLIADGAGGQGHAVRSVLARVDGPVAIVNADLPCATPDDVERLLAETPPDGIALVEAADGTTNALSLAHAELFEPLYGPGSAARFRAAAPARTLEIPNLADDVDTAGDLARLNGRLGPNTRAVLE